MPLILLEIASEIFDILISKDTIVGWIVILVILGLCMLIPLIVTLGSS
jgi:hypothetical protein